MIWRRKGCLLVFLFVAGGILLLGSCKKKGGQVEAEAKEVQLKFNLSSESQQKIKAIEGIAKQKGQNVGGIITGRLITGRILTSRFVTGRMVTARMVTARAPMLIKQEEDWVAMVTAPGVITDGGGRIISALPASEGRWEIDIEVFVGYLDEDFQINGTTIAREEVETDLERGDETKEVDIVLNFDVDDDGDLVSNVDEMLEGRNPSDPGDCLKKVWYKDADSDGYTEGTTQVACVSSSPYNLTSITLLDCDDTDSSIYPGAPLNCSNGKDNDCSGKVEEWFFQDQDSDSWTTSVSQCANIMPSGFTSVYKPTDCDDSNALINPSTEWYVDSDLDGYYGSKITQCSVPANATYTVQVINDCNDSNSSIHPSAPLNCNNNQDNDCSGQIEKWFYQDSDSDSWTTSVSQCANSMPAGFTSVYKPTDCDDTNSLIYPGASLNCNNGQDNDCSGKVDQWGYIDADGDRYAPNSLSSCTNVVFPGQITVGSQLGTNDCDDTDPSIYPGASLNCNNGRDNDCSGQVEAWFFQDQDSDSWTTSVSQCANIMPSGFTSVYKPTDCDDSNALINPSTEWYVDSDLDGYYGSKITQCSAPANATYTVQVINDCNDSKNDVYPGAPLLCVDSEDNDCDSNVEKWAYTDADGDRYAPSSASSCTNTVNFPGQITLGYELGTNDCNDANSSIYPGASLNCNNGQDNDCSGKVDQWGYTDADGDRYAPNSLSSCTNVVFPGQITVGSQLGINDCDDSNSSIYPGASLNCNNGQDNDCSGQIEKWFYQDSDSDSWTTSVSQCANTMPVGFTSVYKPTDCDDSNALINPSTEWYIDSDLDGYYGSKITQCSAPANATYTVQVINDCNDSNSSINPSAPDNTCDSVDNNCNLYIDESTAPCFAPSLTISAYGLTQVSLSWAYPEPSSNVENFVVEKSPNGITFTFLKSLPRSITSYTDNTYLINRYYYRVYAKNATGSGSPSFVTYAPYGVTSLFEKTFGGALIDEARSVIQSSDGGYVVVGRTQSFGAGGMDMYVVKLDASGNVVWTKTFGGALTDEAYSVIQGSDGGYVVVGYTQSFGAGLDDMYVVKLDASGNVMWTKTVGGSNYDSAYSVIQSSDGGYVVVGETWIGAGWSDMYVVKLDASGNIVWTKTVGGGVFDVARSVIQSSDGGYVVAGFTNSFGAGLYDMYVVKLDGSGNIEWTKTVGGSGEDYAYSVIQSSDGGYVVAGFTNSFGVGGWNMYVVKLGASGNIVWTKTVGGASDDYAYSVTHSSDVGYLVAGYTRSFGAGLYDMYVVKLDASGNIVWTKTVGGGVSDEAYSVIQSSDGGYVVAGSTQGFGAGGWDMYVVKIEGDGDLGCHDSFVSPTTNTGGTATFQSPASSFQTPSSSFVSPASYSVASTDIALCIRTFTKTIGGALTDVAYSVIQSSDGGYLVAGYTYSFGAGVSDIYIVKIGGSGNIEWTKTVGGALYDFAYSVIQSSDGGYLVAGYTYSFGAGVSDIYIVKIGGSGNIEWTKTIGGGNYDYAYSVIQSSDGGYVVAGYTGSFGAGGSDIYIVKIGGSGNIEWTKTVGGTSDDEARSVIQSSDGGYVVAGYTYSFGAGGGDIYIVKIDGSGNIEWTKTVGGALYDFAYSVIQSSDGGYVVAGYTYSFGAGGGDIYIVKIGGSGNIEWTKTIGGGNYDYAYSVIQSSDGGYVVVGYTNSFGAGGSDIYIVKIGGSGNIEWTKTVGGALYDFAYSVIQSSDGGYVVVGHTNFGASDMYVVKLDASGNVVWTKTVGGVGSDIASSIIQSSDGGYVVVGYTKSFGAGSSDFYIVKAGPSFDTCFSQAITNYTVGSGGSVSSPTPSTYPVSPTVYAISPTTGSGGSVGNVCVSPGAPVLPMCYAQGSCEESIATIPFYYHQSSSDGSGYYRTTSKDSSYGCSVGLGEICIPLLFMLYILFKVLPVKGRFKKKMF